MTMILEGNLTDNYSEVDVLRCLWPRQDFAIQNWTASIETNLNKKYSLHVGK